MFFANRRQLGMTLAEVLITLVVLLVLISAAVRMGQYVRIRSAVQLTDSMLAVLDTALQLYYEDVGTFPFYSADGNGNRRPDDYFWPHMRTDIESLPDSAAGSVNAVNLLEKDGNGVDQSFASSAALYFFLNRQTNSRSIVSALSPSLISTAHPQETHQRLALTVTRLTPPPQTVTMGRFVDAWGTSLWYRYESNWAFPRVISAGPDRIFGTADDLENR